MNTTRQIVYNKSQYNFTTPDPLPYDSGHKSTVNQFYKNRNVTVGVIGVILNLIALTAITRCKKLHSGRKILLFNLVLSDSIALFIALIYGSMKQTLTSSSSDCLSVSVSMLASIQASYLTSFKISVGTYLAVCKPFDFKRIRGWKLPILSVIVVWIVLIIVAVVLVGVDIPPGIFCSPMVVCPRKSIAIILSMQIVATIGVIVFNFGAIFQIKKLQKRRQKYKRKTFFYVKPSPTGIFTLSAKVAPLNKTDDSVEEPCNNSKTFRCSVADQSSIKTNFSKRSRYGIFYVNQSYVECHPYHFHDTGCEGTEMSDHGFYSHENNMENTNTANECGRHDNKSGVDRTIRDVNAEKDGVLINNANVRIRNDGICGNVASNTNDINQPHTSNHNNISNSTHHPCDNTNYSDPRYMVCKMLLVITTLSCTMSLPTMVMMFGIASYMIDDPQQSITSPLGLLAGTFPIIKACVNAFLYVLCFSDLKSKLVKFIQLCKTLIPT